MKRIFLDSSVLFAAAYSEKGYARDLLAMGIREQVILVISPLVMEETRRNLGSYAPATLPALERIFNLLPFEISSPLREDVLKAAEVVALKDAPILAAAKVAHVDMLVTLDQRHLLERPDLEKFMNGRILRPKEAYQAVLDE